MNKVACSLILFLYNFCVIAFFSNNTAIASNLSELLLADNSPTTSPTDGKTVLKGGAQDAEKMQKSIKLMVPDPSAPRYSPATQPPQFQTGATQSDIFRQSLEFQERAAAAAAREQAAAARAEVLLKQQAEAEHQAALQRHFGIEAETNFAPSRVPFTRRFMPDTGKFESTVVPMQPRQPQQAQADPWTDVVAVPYRQKKLAELQTSIKQLHSAPTLARQALATGQLESPTEKHIEPLKAVEMMLPMTPAPKDWDAWYKRVASAIYDRWRQNTAGPGTSVVLITVYASRDVDCRVTNFTEAEGAERNSTEESRFKQVSLQCVDGLSGDEIWQFPAIQPLPKKIVFDMEFKHVVGEDSGCRIVHLHNELPPQPAP
ncbi:MAG: hypothetical protein P4L53_13225 [Candidatus Obscuribacterales bacterium]|nr:hypothetical protein [Candidatus Obscuribacterales bacterium]